MAQQLWLLRHGEAEPHGATDDDDRLLTGRLRESFDVREATALLLAVGEDKRVLLVGHEPDFSQIVHDLSGARIDLKKGGLAAVRVQRKSGELVALLRPRELESL